MKINTLFLLLLSLILFYNCKGDDKMEEVTPLVDTTTKKTPPKKVKPLKKVDTSATNFKAKSFIYDALRFAYVFKDDVPDLADNKFRTRRDYELFLDESSSPEELWETLIYSKEDRFSYLFDDLKDTSEFMRLEFEFKFFERNNGEIYIIVTRVEKNTLTESIGIKRGMIFNKINGDFITKNNQIDFFTQNSFEIEQAEFEKDVLISTGKTFYITKSSFSENPVGISKVLEIDTKKIGYLLFNSFNRFYDEELNTEFANLQFENVTDLILDLRYNVGGSVDTAYTLISLITGQFEGETISFSKWNSNNQKEFQKNNPERLSAKFPTTTFEAQTPLNSLNLNKLYVITSKEQTASASELVINSLKPYIDVVIIGDERGTVGKSRASLQIFDAGKQLSLDFEEASDEHNYYIQPLVYRLFNKNNQSITKEGIQPNIIKSEDFSDLGILGDLNEPLLKVAIDDILGTIPTSAKKTNTFSIGKEIGNSKENDPQYQRMYHSKDIDLKFTSLF